MPEDPAKNVAETEIEHWSLRLVGQFRVAYADGRECRISGRRERALLAYLAMAPNFRETRRNLATLLWGDDTDALTLDNLRTCLWSLRKALGEDGQHLVGADREWIYLDTGLITVDARQLQDVSTAGHQDQAECLLQVTDGELLEGLDLATPAFQDWVRMARSRYAEAVTGILSRSLAARQAAGDAVGALAASERMLRVDPFDEVALRSIIALQAAAGRRHLALQEFRRFADRLRGELGVEPEAETTALIDQIAGSASRQSVVEVDEGRKAITDGPPAVLQQAASGTDTAESRERVHPHQVARMMLIGWVGAGMMLVVIAVIAGVIWTMPALAPNPLADWIRSVQNGFSFSPPSLAALPFQSHGDPGAGEFADALVESVTSALARASDIIVVSRGSVDELKGSTLNKRDIARRLGVRYLLTGDVTQRGNTVAVSGVWLIDTTEGKEFPIGDFSGQISDFFTLIQDITRKVVTALQVKLTEGDQERITVYQGTRNHQAWLLAAQGHKELRSLVPGAHIAARDHFREALSLDENFTGAMTGLGWTYLVEPFLGLSRNHEELVREADDWAKRALALDKRRAATHALLGATALFSGDLDAALVSGERAVNWEQSDADSAALLALTKTYAGEPEAALVLLERAIRLKPYPPRWYLWLEARAHRHAGRPKEAIRILLAADATQNRSLVPMVELVLAYSEAGMRDDAQLQARRVRDLRQAFNSSQWARVPRYRNPETRQREVDALNAAGLGE